MMSNIKCERCGKPISIEVTHCPHCNWHVTDNVSADDNAIVATRALLRDERVAEEMIHCHACGKAFSAYVDRCPACGKHTHHESHFEDRATGLLQSRGVRMLFYLVVAAVSVFVIGWLLADAGPEGPAS
ncbi:MAG: hypothetical protein KDA42_04005 [Planctomycetales bacterium]|nr:hypothetical protein [Planctomycetales bacterium]